MQINKMYFNFWNQFAYKFNSWRQVIILKFLRRVICRPGYFVGNNCMNLKQGYYWNSHFLFDLHIIKETKYSSEPKRLCCLTRSLSNFIIRLARKSAMVLFKFVIILMYELNACAIRSIFFVEHPTRQMSHLKGFFPSWTRLMWYFRWGFRAKLESQIIDLNGFFPSWTFFLCLFKYLLGLKAK